jgi:hypothetical protein
VIWLEIPLFNEIETALHAPQDADICEFLKAYDHIVSELDEQSYLRIGSDLLVQLFILFEAKYVAFSQSLSSSLVEPEHLDPIGSDDFFDRYVYQSMNFRFDEYIEPIPWLEIPMAEEWIPPDRVSGFYSASDPTQEVLDSIIDELGVMLEALSDRTEQQQLDDIKELSHGEEIEIWSNELASIVAQLQRRKKQQMPFLDLVHTLKLSRMGASLKECYTDMWIAFMLGDHGYCLDRRTGDFYSPVGIEIIRQLKFSLLTFYVQLAIAKSFRNVMELIEL